MNIAVSAPADDLPPRRAFTVADISRMIDAGVIGEEERIELVGGDIVVMVSNKFAHELIKSAIIRALVPLAPPDVHVGVEMSIEFSDEVLLEPDIVVFPRPSMRKSDLDFVRLHHGECLLVVEVAASSLRYDKITKAPLYAAFGVREYWVIDAQERVTWIHKGPSNDGWSSVVKLDSNETLTTSAIPGFAFRLDAIT